MNPGVEILVTLPRPLYRELFTAETEARLGALGTVRRNLGDRNWTAAELAAHLGGIDACIIGWDSPPFDAAALQAADRLRIISHTAGTIKSFCPPEVFQRGIVVTQAAVALAPAVGELALWLAMTALRRLDEINLRSPAWFDSSDPAYAPGAEIGGQRVGIVGAGWSGREAIRVFRGVGAEVWVCDPLLSRERADELGVRLASLHTLLAECRVVSLHAPALPETRHMIGKRELALLPDGAVLVNTARAWVVDPAALLAELDSGRIVAALDVFDAEPLPAGDPLRHRANVVLTPHMGGTSRQARSRQGRAAVEEVARFLAGEPLLYQVTLDMLARIA